MRFLTTLLLLLLTNQPCNSQYIQLLLPDTTGKYEFRLRASTEMTVGKVYPQMDIAWRRIGEISWSAITSRVNLYSLRCPTKIQTVKLMKAKGGWIQAVVVWGDGDTRSIIDVIKINVPTPFLPTLHTLMTEWSVNDPKLFVNKSGILFGIQLSYDAYQALDEHGKSSLFPGHILVCKTYTWNKRKNKFEAGPFSVDKENESRLTLVDVLTMPHVEQRLHIISEVDEKTNTSIYKFKPLGILYNLVPANLKSSKLIKAVVSDSYDKTIGEYKTVISDIYPISGK